MMKDILRILVMIALVSLTTLVGCGGNQFEPQADRIKGHVEKFYMYLGGHKVAKAVAENERIEAVAHEGEERLLRKVGQLSQDERRQEWAVITTAKQAAAENWLALARYFTQRKQYDRARGTYQRLVETYQGKPYKTYVRQAEQGLKDLENILNPEKAFLADGQAMG